MTEASKSPHSSPVRQHDGRNPLEKAKKLQTNNKHHTSPPPPPPTYLLVLGINLSYILDRPSSHSLTMSKMSNASTKANRIIKPFFCIRRKEAEVEIKENKPFKTVTMGDHNFFYKNHSYTMSKIRCGKGIFRFYMG